MKLFYSGTNIKNYAFHSEIEGFTTNVTFMAQAREFNYKTFYEINKEAINGRSLSLQVYSDDDKTIYQDAHKLASYGDNIIVKIPIIKSTGETNLPIIEKLLKEGIKINITAIFTIAQIRKVYDVLRQCPSTYTIVSIFAGRISDTGVDPFPIVQFACTLLSDMLHVDVLWEGCKEVLSISHAHRAGCGIITIPDAILDRLGRRGLDLTRFSQETVNRFKLDGEMNQVTI